MLWLVIHLPKGMQRLFKHTLAEGNLSDLFVSNTSTSTLLPIWCWVKCYDSQTDLKEMAGEIESCVVKTETHSSCFTGTLVESLVFLLMTFLTEMKKLWRAGAALCDISFYFWIPREMNVCEPQHSHFYCHSSKIEISCTTTYSLWLNFLLPKQPIRNINGQNQFHNKTVCVLYHGHIILNFCWFCLRING